MATELGIDSATRLYAVTSALVERYAPGAPEGVRSEAIVRCAGYLHADAPAAKTLRRMQAGEDLTIEPRPAGNALRLSGAAALLSPWRVRRAIRDEDD